ncbi:hypothetical protein [Limosilactobacillus reuteri]|uniref:hypothetical protein n=1 Tax=Limosilactobacillus reuteri TaxID=1598 RepID=UPI0021A58305|nr:hypothetical protein [Limosilactobacillus reuteri]
MAALQYTAWSNPDQNNEFELKVTSDAIYFIPIMPTTYVIDEAFYNKIYNILNVALTPTLTMIRPLSMQIKILPDNEPAKQRALYYPMHLGRSKRLVCGIDDLVNLYHQTHAIPLMDRIAWDPIKSPHAIITGVSGSGKSYAMTTLYSICSKIGETVVIDPKTSNLARLTKTNPASKVIIPDFDTSRQQGIGGRYLTTVVNELKSLEAEMYKRQAMLYKQDQVSANFESVGLKPIFLFIDEAAALLTGANRQIKQDYLDTLTRLAVLGREAGLFLVMAMQSARAEYIPTLVRDSISLRIQLGRLNSENTRFLFPELSDMPIIPLGGNGSEIVSIAGNNVTAGIEPISMPTIIEGDKQ